MSNEPENLCAVEGSLVDCQMYRTRWVRGVEIPTGSYWAEPPAVAADPGELGCPVTARAPVYRSVMRELLTAEEIRHLEVREGWFLLPGTPP